MITSQDEKHIRDIIVNRYISAIKTSTDRYPFSPHDISNDLAIYWGLRISMNKIKNDSLSILVELLPINLNT